jgi:tRNA-dihydrouridine synthase
MKSYLDNLPQPFMVLAPMDDVTDTVFRQIIAGLSPSDLYFTEFVNVDGLQSPGRPNLLKKLQFTNHEHPLVAQVWGVKPENYFKTASELVEMGFDGMDINMGCPVKTVIKNGACAALINNQTLAGEIIQAAREGLGGKIPLSVKTRIGYKEYDKKWLEFILNQKLNMLSIHLRTAKEMSKVPAHWEFLGELKDMRDELSPATLLVGNGDIMNRAEAEQLIEKYGIDGAMIGRGVFHDPFAFAEKSEWADYPKEQKVELYTQHVKLFVETWGENQRPVHTLNKFCKIYINGFDGAKEFRDELMHCQNAGELLSKLGANSN